MIHRRLAQTLDVSIAITQSMATTVSIARVITAIVSMAIVSIVVTVSIVIIASILPQILGSQLEVKGRSLLPRTPRYPSR